MLITHAPPAGILDEAGGQSAGCEDLRTRVAQVRPRLHVLGHIHESRGALWRDGVLLVNATTDERQAPAVTLGWPPREPELPR